MAHEIHIKTVDGGVVYDHALGYGRTDGDLWIQVGEDPDHADTIYFASSYWQQYVVDPHSADPLDLDAEYEDDEDYEDVEYEDYKDEPEDADAEAAF